MRSNVGCKARRKHIIDIMPTVEHEHPETEEEDMDQDSADGDSSDMDSDGSVESSDIGNLSTKYIFKKDSSIRILH